jgi:hypothetical protein
MTRPMVELAKRKGSSLTTLDSALLQEGVVLLGGSHKHRAGFDSVRFPSPFGFVVLSC